MKIINEDIEKVIPYTRNPRNNAGAVAKVAASINEYGWQQPIVVDEKMTVIAGHTRLLAARQLGLKKVPIQIAKDLTPNQVKAYRIADNRTGEESEWDFELLSLELGDLNNDEVDLSLTGFDEVEISRILANENDGGLTDPDEIPELESNRVTELGDVWSMGKHRLMCGDSSLIKSIKLLMAGQKANLTFTSPPYNGDTQIDYGKKGRFNLYDNSTDKWTGEEYIKFCQTVLNNIFEVTKGFIFWNVMYNTKSKFEYIKCINEHVELLIETIVWKKTGMPTSQGLTRNYEFVFCFNNGVRKHLTQLYDGETNLWDISNLNCQADNLKACFPVGLPEKGITMGSDFGDICLEPFGGSGTTLIACEKTKRICRIMELDPNYCNVIIKRWQNFTGKQAIRESDGKKYDDLIKDNAESK